MSEPTFFWHDYETWGIDPRRDRPVQFAGVRTTLELELIDEPIMIYCRPAPDFLPSPDAALITGITPQLAYDKGMNEASFFEIIHKELSRPHTCGVGYNSIRFDDEVTRFGLYRNFYDPYAREWKEGNSRWDILDLVRMTYALRPEDFSWPVNDEGKVSFRLELLTDANGIEQEGAHDALVDVMATLAIARLIKKLKPRLFDFYYDLRQKGNAARMLNLQTQEIVLHVSGMYKVEEGCIAPVIPILQHPVNKNEIIVYDCRHDPEHLLTLTPDEIAINLFTPNDERPKDEQRVALKSVHLNKCPALAPVNTLSPELAERWNIHWDQVKKNREKLLSDGTLKQRLQQMHLNRQKREQVDADAALYDGFISNDDRLICEQVLRSKPEDLANWQPPFNDPRLKTLYFRYRARNWPETLSEGEQQDWAAFCQERIVEGKYGCTLTKFEFESRMEDLALQALSQRDQRILEQLAQWVQEFY